MTRTMTETIRLTLTIEEAKMVKFLLSYGLDRVQMVKDEENMINKLVYVLETKIG